MKQDKQHNKYKRRYKKTAYHLVIPGVSLTGINGYWHYYQETADSKNQLHRAITKAKTLNFCIWTVSIISKGE